MKAFFKSGGFKALLIFVLVLLFLIPLGLIRGVIRERERRSQNASAETVRLWGGQQTVASPLLAIPFEYIQMVDDKKVKYNSVYYQVPANWTINGEMDTEVRTRGIYSVPVYVSHMAMEGYFEAPDFSSIDVIPEKIYWEKAAVVLGVSNPGYITEPVLARIQDKDTPMESGRFDTGILTGSLQAPAAITDSAAKIHFDIAVSFKGGEDLSFLPLAEKNRVTLMSDWPAPSFNGAHLPDSKEHGENGFSANWNILSYGKLYPSVWRGKVDNRPEYFSGDRFGVSLFQPVNVYHKSERAAKYGLLFVLVPFLTLFLFELFAKARIHPIQYVFIGLANTVFYLLLLSMAEHIPFWTSYLSGAVATAGIIIFYVRASLKDHKNASFAMVPVLAGLYVYLYMALQSEDYALLIGSIGLFVILALVMVITRNINWFSLGMGKPNS